MVQANIQRQMLQATQGRFHWLLFSSVSPKKSLHGSISALFTMYISCVFTFIFYSSVLFLWCYADCWASARLLCTMTIRTYLYLSMSVTANGTVAWSNGIKLNDWMNSNWKSKWGQYIKSTFLPMCSEQLFKSLLSASKIHLQWA